MILALLLGGCAGSAVPVTSPTPAVVMIVGTPYAAYAAATPPATLHDRPAGTPIGTLPHGADVTVEALVPTPDGQIWYLVVAASGERGWVAAPSLSLVDDPIVPTATPRPAPPTPMPPAPTSSPTPRPLVITGSGQGLFLRAEPGQGAIVRAYPDGTRVILLGETRELDGRRWLKVRTPDGEVGWMAAEYLRPG